MMSEAAPARDRPKPYACRLDPQAVRGDAAEGRQRGQQRLGRRADAAFQHAQVRLADPGEMGQLGLREPRAPARLVQRGPVVA